MKIVSENQFSGKTYFYTIGPRFYFCKLIIIAAVFEFAVILRILNSSKMPETDIETFRDNETTEVDKERIRSRKIDARAFLCFNIVFASFCVIYGIVCMIMGGEI